MKTTPVEQQFALFARSLPDALLLVTGEGEIRVVNRAFADCVAQSTESLRGKLFFDLVEDSPQEVRAYLSACARTPEPLPGACTVRRPDGETIPCRVSGAAVLSGSDDEGALLQLRFTPHRDAIELLQERIEHLTQEIAVRKRAEALSEAERSRLEVTLSSIGDAVIATDSRGCITMMNPVAERLTGWPMREAVGRRCAEIFCITNEETGEEVESPVDCVLRDGVITGFANHTILTARDGRQCPIDDSGAPIRNRDGEIVGTVLVFRDVTERRRRENTERFLLQLDETIRPLNDPEEVLWQTVRALGQYLKVARCTFAEVQPEQDSVTVHRDYCRGVASHAGAWPLSAFGAAAVDVLSAGETLVITDTRTDPRTAGSYESIYLPLQLRSAIAAPLLKEGRFVAVLAVHATEPRAWSAGDIALVERVLEQTWLSVENARLYRMAQEELKERQRVEQELRESEILYRTLGEVVPDFVWAFRLDMGDLYVNPRWTDYTGLTLDQALYVPRDYIYHPDDFPGLERTWEKAAAHKQAYEAEFRMRRYDGTFRWFMTRAVPVKDDAGNIIRWIGTTTDIHDRKMMEEALRRSEEQFRFALTNSNISVYVMDANLRYTWVYSGKYNAELTYLYGKADADIMAQEDAAYLTAIKNRVLQTGVEERHIARVTYPGQEAAYHDTVFAPLRDEAGKIIGITGTASDITSRKKVQDALAMHQVEIEALNARLQRAMRETHHRVKNNLQVIISLLNLHMMHYPDSVPVTELETLTQHVQALAAIHDLLTYQARKDNDVSDVSVREAMDKLLPIWQNMTIERPLDVSVDDIRLPIRYATSLAVLINELVSNSVKHGAGRMILKFETSGDQARINMMDEGPGFPEDFDVETAAHTGLELIGSTVEWDLQGTVRYGNRAEGGAQILIEFPLPRLTGRESVA